MGAEVTGFAKGLVAEAGLHVGAIYRQLFEAGSSTEIFERAVEGARVLFDADMAWCLLLVGDTLVPTASSGWRTGSLPSDFFVPAGEGVGGRVILDGRTVIVRDYQRDPRRISSLKAILDQEGVRGGIAAPIPGEVGSIGVFYVAWRNPVSLGEEDAAAVTRFVRDLGAAVAVHDAREELGDRVRELTADLGAIRDADHLIAGVAETFVVRSDLAEGLRPVAATLGAALRIIDASGLQVISVTSDEVTAPARLVGDFALAGALGRLQVMRLRPLSSVEKQLLGHLADLVALQFLRDRTEAETELRVRGQLLDDILTATDQPEDDLRRRAALLGVKLRPPCFVVCIGLHAAADGETPPPATRVADAIHHACRLRLGRPLATWRDGALVLLLAGGPAARAEARSTLSEVMEEASQLLGGADLVAGMGPPAGSLAEYRRSYRDATSAFELAQSRGLPGRVLLAEDLGLYGLLAQATRPDALRALAERALGPLLDQEEKSRELLRTLILYLEHDRNAERTACALHVHVNTLRYRVGRIEDLLDIDLRDVDSRFLIELAVRVLKVLEAAPEA